MNGVVLVESEAISVPRIFADPPSSAEEEPGNVVRAQFASEEEVETTFFLTVPLVSPAHAISSGA